MVVYVLLVEAFHHDLEQLRREREDITVPGPHVWTLNLVQPIALELLQLFLAVEEGGNERGVERETLHDAGEAVESDRKWTSLRISNVGFSCFALVLRAWQ